MLPQFGQKWDRSGVSQNETSTVLTKALTALPRCLDNKQTVESLCEESASLSTVNQLFTFQLPPTAIVLLPLLQTSPFFDTCLFFLFGLLKLYPHTLEAVFLRILPTFWNTECFLVFSFFSAGIRRHHSPQPFTNSPHYVRRA